MINLTWGQYKAAGRHALSYAAGGITVAAAMGLISQGDSTTLMAGLNQLVDGLENVVKAVGVIAGVLVPIYTTYKATHSASPQEQLKTVAAMPEIKGIVATPALAAETPSAKVVATPAELPPTVTEIQPIKPASKVG